MRKLHLIEHTKPDYLIEQLIVISLARMHPAQNTLETQESPYKRILCFN
jgi:hypothetical protein